MICFVLFFSRNNTELYIFITVKHFLSKVTVDLYKTDPKIDIPQPKAIIAKYVAKIIVGYVMEYKCRLIRCVEKFSAEKHFSIVI